jgi:hypothetical protein
MGHTVVKITKGDDGERRDDPVWCYVFNDVTGLQTLCCAEYFTFGESRCEYKTKSVDKGGITCKRCLEIIKHIKSIKL